MSSALLAQIVTWNGGNTTWSQPDSDSWTSATYNSRNTAVFAGSGTGGRSLLSLGDFGDIANVDDAAPTDGNPGQLVSGFDVGGDVNRAHRAVEPGGA